MTTLLSIYKLLSDETRLRMLVLLYLDELCVCQLSGILEAPQPRISKNLSKLRDLEMVRDLRKEKYVYYTLRDPNDLLRKNLEHILANKALYPVMAQDIEKLKTKASYIQ